MMLDSNIVAGSNVYLSRTNDPRQDPEFVEQILDHDLLKALVERRKVDRRIPALTKEQMSIVHRGIRCTFAKNDPCIGLVEGKGTQCKCINIKCPGIYDRSSFYGTVPWKGCNPNVTEEYIRQWTPDLQEEKLYGDPGRLRSYYIVDMISDEEMDRYDPRTRREGDGYPVPKNPILPNSQDKIVAEKRYKIDPVSGRKMVVVGYRLVITDNADYQSDELIPIWGSVEEVEGKHEETVVRKKAKRISKKTEVTIKRQKSVKKTGLDIDSDYARKEEFEQAVSASIAGEIKLTEVEPDNISDEDGLIVLLDNPAELAFVSGTFLVSLIPHGIDIEQPVRLSLIDDYKKTEDQKHVMISDTALKRGCSPSNVQAWKALASEKEIELLHVAERDYYNYSYGEQKNRWTCRNMYGVTHVCVKPDDVCSLEELSDGTYPVSLVEDGDTYMILEKSGDLIGRLGKEFVDAIDALKDASEISGTPAMINGISLQVKDGKMEILGMGHLKFIEY